MTEADEFKERAAQEDPVGAPERRIYLAWANTGVLSTDNVEGHDAYEGHAARHEQEGRSEPVVDAPSHLDHAHNGGDGQQVTYIEQDHQG